MLPVGCPRFPPKNGSSGVDQSVALRPFLSSYRYVPAAIVNYGASCCSPPELSSHSLPPGETFCLQTAFYRHESHEAMQTPLLDIGARRSRSVSPSRVQRPGLCARRAETCRSVHQSRRRLESAVQRDRKSTRLNSSHSSISYAVFC